MQIRPLPTLRQLRYLVAVADHGHFGRAADDCFVTQSTLSVGIRELEEVLGATLVLRGKRQVALTPVGQDIVVRARALLRDAEQILDAAHAGGRPLTGLLRLGVIPTIGPYLLPRAMPAVRAAWPELRLYLREERTAGALDLLRRGRLDAALIALPYAVGDLRTCELGEDPLLVACPADHPFARLGEVSAADVMEEPLLLLEDGHCLRDHALTACRLTPGLENEDMQATSLGTLVQMVAGGMGLTMIPELAVEVEIRREPTLCAVRFRDERPARRIALAWRPDSVRVRDLLLLGDALRPFAPVPSPSFSGEPARALEPFASPANGGDPAA